MASKQKTKNTYNLSKAFQDLFMQDGKLKPEAEKVLAFLRNESASKGELGCNGSPYLYDNQGRFDFGAAAFILGKQRMFNLIIKHLSLDLNQIFNLRSVEEEQMDDLDILKQNIDI